MNDAQLPTWVRLLMELRRRLLRVGGFFAAIFAVFLYFSNDLYTGLALPLLQRLPHGQGLIATQVAAAVMVPMELAAALAVLLIMPYALYQAWRFIEPALYATEKRWAWPLIVFSVLLFYLGVAFAYHLLLPVLFGLMIQSLPKGVMLMPDMSHYLDFTLKLLLTFGFIFEIPMLTLMLVWTGICSRAQLVAARPYVIVAAFIVGMLLSPPDVLSQTLLAVPMWLLFEIGLLLAGSLMRSRLTQMTETV